MEQDQVEPSSYLSGRPDPRVGRPLPTEQWRAEVKVSSGLSLQASDVFYQPPVYRRLIREAETAPLTRRFSAPLTT